MTSVPKREEENTFRMLPRWKKHLKTTREHKRNRAFGTNFKKR